MDEHEITQNPICDIKDVGPRKTGLKIFGIIQIIIGSFLMLSIAGIILTVYNSDDYSLSKLISIFIYSSLSAACYIWLGIGSIKAKRWARTTTLAFAWIYTLQGLCMAIMMTAFYPNSYYYQVKIGKLTPQVADTRWIVYLTVVTLIFVGIPAAFLLFYRSKNAKAACEFRNPAPCWTDKCPMAVFVASVLFVTWAVKFMFMGNYGWAVPFFGFFVSGTMGVVVSALIAMLCVCIAVGIYKLKTFALWAGVVLVILWVISSCITYYRISMMEYYEIFQTPNQLEVTRECELVNGFHQALYHAAWLAGVAIYLVCIKKYFKPADTTVEA